MFDVHITFPFDQFHAMLAAFEEQFAAQHDHVLMLDCGCSQKQEVGYIVLEWDDEVDPAFIDQLTNDSTILDFCTFSVIFPSDDPLYALTITQEGEPHR